MRRVVEAAINAAKPDGLTRCYFRLTKWEGELRELFLGLPEELAAAELPQPKPILDKMQKLSDWYRTSRTKPDFALILEAVREEVRRERWAMTPPRLLGSSENELREIAEVVRRVLRHVKTRRTELGNNTYSFVTKFLHFLYPETFAIYDSQVWKSVKRVETETKPHVTRRRSADWYLDVLLFYRDFWQTAETSDLARPMAEAVRELEARFQDWSRTSRARVTVVDAIDKFLYLAAGDERELGLTSPRS